MNYTEAITPQKRIILLIAIMSGVVICAMSIAVGFLYRTALSEERARLQETARSQARLIESVARFDAIYSKDYPLGARQATLDQIQDAHGRYEGVWKNRGVHPVHAGRRANCFPAQPSPYGPGKPKACALGLPPGRSYAVGPFQENQEPSSDPDYRGATVLAAYEPIKTLNPGHRGQD